MNSAKLIRTLQQAGWVLGRIKGSHHVFTHADRPGHITVPHPKQDLGIGITNAILRQAGLR